MNCPACGKESENNLICSHCGHEFTKKSKHSTDHSEFKQTSEDESDEETAATISSETESQPMNEKTVSSTETEPEKPATETSETKKRAETKETVEQMQETFVNFGHFLLKYLKHPMTAGTVNRQQYMSGTLTMIVFALIIALNVFLNYRVIAMFTDSNVFLDGFLMPFLNIVILFIVAIAITYAGITLSHQTLSFTDTVARYGAFAVPFLALYVLAFIISLMKLTKVFLIVASASLIGMLIVIPTIIILQNSSNRFDQLYIIIGITIVNMIALNSVISSFINRLFGGMLGQFMGGF